MSSRWGGFRAGRKLYTSTLLWDDMKSNGAENTTLQPTKPTNFDYSTAQGMRNLNSTYQFPKRSTPSIPSIPVGLSNSLFSVTGQNAVWVQRSVNISQYANRVVRIVFRYLNGSSFTGDIQVDLINISGTSYNFENTGHAFQTSTVGETAYTSVSWQTLAVGTTNARWNVHTGNTPSTGTALGSAASGSYYVYAETTAPGDAAGYNFWLRSPQITLNASPTLTFFEARSGNGIGTLHVHVDVIA